MLNCAAVGGLPPIILLTVVPLAFSPPVIAVSIQVPPIPSHASANFVIAACSPPEVHQ